MHVYIKITIKFTNVAISILDDNVYSCSTKKTNAKELSVLLSDNI